MIQRYLIAGMIALIAAQTAFASDADDDLRAEQQELLAWAQTLRYQARVKEAISVCDKIVSADPTCTDAWVEHGVIALSEARFVVAQEDFLHALAHDPHHPMALVGQAHVQHALGNSEHAQRNAARALQRCNRIIDAGAADAQTWYVRGLARMLLQDERGLQDFATAVSLDPAHMDARGERAHIYRSMDRLDAGIDELTRAVEIRPDYAVGYLSRARMHYEAGDLELSIADCDAALQVNADYEQAWHNRGLVNIEREDFEAAIADLTEAIRVDPEYASAHVYRGQAYLAAGDTDAARADWEKTQELDPDGWAGQAAEEMLAKLQQSDDAEADVGG
ncbi:MAG: tetratricopeptide repeat protein [Armatimonadota bacterium]